MKTSSRHLDQDEHIRLSYTSSEDVFKTSWSRSIYLSWPYVFKTSSRCLEDTLPTRLQEVFKTSSRRPGKTSSRHLQDVFKTSCQDVMFSKLLKDLLQKRLQDIFKTSCKDVFKTFSRRIININCSC